MRPGFDCRTFGSRALGESVPPDPHPSNRLPAPSDAAPHPSSRRHCLSSPRPDRSPPPFSFYSESIVKPMASFLGFSRRRTRAPASPLGIYQRLLPVGRPTEQHVVVVVVFAPISWKLGYGKRKPASSSNSLEAVSSGVSSVSSYPPASPGGRSTRCPAESSPAGTHASNRCRRRRPRRRLVRELRNHSKKSNGKGPATRDCDCQK